MCTSSKILGTAKHIRQKPAYSLGQNISYMISLAWKQRRSQCHLVRGVRR